MATTGQLVTAEQLVEVLSPNEKAGEMQRKIQDYLRAGTRLLWLIDPESRTLTAYRPDGTAKVHSASDRVTGEDVVSGFSFLLAELFEE